MVRNKMTWNFRSFLISFRFFVVPKAVFQWFLTSEHEKSDFLRSLLGVLKKRVMVWKWDGSTRLLFCLRFLLVVFKITCFSFFEFFRRFWFFYVFTTAKLPHWIKISILIHQKMMIFWCLNQGLVHILLIQNGWQIFAYFRIFHFFSKNRQKSKKSIFWGPWDFPGRRSHVLRGHTNDLITGLQKVTKSFHYFLIKKWQKIMKKWQKVTKSDKRGSEDVGVGWSGPRSCWASQTPQNLQNLRDPSKTRVRVFDHFLSGFLKSIWAYCVLSKKYQIFIEILIIFDDFLTFSFIYPYWTSKTIRSST